MRDGGGEAPTANQAMPVRLLLVEDDEHDALLIVRALRRRGFAVTWERVETKAALSEALARADWDVVTCDWVMPTLDPVTVLTIIRERLPGLPIIAISGETRDEIRLHALRAGARHFVGKNKLALLAPIVEAVLCNSGGQQPAATDGTRAPARRS